VPLRWMYPIVSHVFTSFAYKLPGALRPMLPLLTAT